MNGYSNRLFILLGSYVKRIACSILIYLMKYYIFQRCEDDFVKGHSFHAEQKDHWMAQLLIAHDVFACKHIVLNIIINLSDFYL
jgi:hypothetical protein